MFYIHKITWEPGKYTKERLLPGYNTKKEADAAYKAYGFRNINNNTSATSYEIKEENLNGN